jgi:uncharacterized membrane protein required for colicin V production
VTFFDWAVIAITVGFMVRGWRKGIVGEAVDVGLLLLGTLIVFRMSPVLGTIISGMANVPYEVGRIVAGSVVFLGLVAAAILFGRVIVTALRVVPGASTLNRIGGAIAGLVFAALVSVLGATLVSSTPLPETLSRAVDDAIDGSVIGRTVVDPAGLVQPLIAVASGEELFGTVIAVRSAVGDRLMAGTVPVPFPSVAAGPGDRIGDEGVGRLPIGLAGSGWPASVSHGRCRCPWDHP